MIFMGFLLRDEDGKRTSSYVRVPVHNVWTEGPTDDIHVQFRKGGDNFLPLWDKNGDLVIPSPFSSKKTAVAYQMDFHAIKKGDEPLATPEAYIRRLKKLWTSPNQPGRKSRIT